jgi:hypothetical protein
MSEEIPEVPGAPGGRGPTAPPVVVLSNLPTLNDCFIRAATTTEQLGFSWKLEAMVQWVNLRKASLSVGSFAEAPTHRCSVGAHGQTFSATSNQAGFPGSWDAILGAIEACELFEGRAAQV